MSTLVIVIIVLALVFDYINGFHDAANSIATVVSTKVLTPLQAVLWAALFNFVAFFIFKDHAVANTISKTVIDNYITLPVILAGLIAAIFWNLLTWWYGIPSSSSHTLIGGFAGAALAHAFYTKGWVPFGEVVEFDKISKTVYFILLAPLIGMLISIFITLVTIKRNIYGKMALILISSAVLGLMFNSFRHTKLEENLAKFYKVDKYKKELAKKPNDEAVQKKFEKATANYEASKGMLADYDDKGGKYVAAEIGKAVSLDYLIEGKLKDLVSKKIKLEMAKKAAFYDDSKKAIVEEKEAILDECKPYFKNYSVVGAGLAYLNKGDFDNALDYLNKVDAKDRGLNPAIIAAKATCYSEKGDYKKAAGLFERAAKESDNDLSAGYYVRAAQHYEKADKLSDALSCYETIAKKYSTAEDGRYLQTAELNIYRLKGLIGDLN